MSYVSGPGGRRSRDYAPGPAEQGGEEGEPDLLEGQDLIQYEMDGGVGIFDIQAHIWRARDVPEVREYRPRDTAQCGTVQQVEG